LQGNQDVQISDWFTLSKIYSFDININRYDDHLTIYENVSSLDFPSGINGGLKFAAGEVNQAHSFIVLVQISSSSSEALDLISISNDTYSVSVTSTQSSNPSPLPNDPVTLDIIIFTRPHSLQFGHTTISTTNLPITIWPDLYFETYHLQLSSKFGSITGSESWQFVAHEIDVSTYHGDILGNWALPGSISLTATNGSISIELIPKQWSSGPYTAGSLFAFAGAGDIDIRMPLQCEALSLRNGTSVIEAPRGSISGTFVHGAVTSLKAYKSINATIKPYWAFYEWSGIQHNFITTTSLHGNTSIIVLPPRIEPYYKINPLWFSVSKHVQGTGLAQVMQLTYPGEWGGVATGYSGFGARIEVSGEDFEEVERSEKGVKVQRPPKSSELYFEADVGRAELRLNACEVPGCGYPTD
jgi:hypothetical protein